MALPEQRPPLIISTIWSPIAIGAIAGIGTIGTIQSGAITASISGGQLQYVGTMGTLQAQANIAVASLVGSIGSPISVAGGTIGTVQSLANLAIASLVGLVATVGTVVSQANLAVASLVGSLGSPIAVAGGTIGTVQSLANLAIASLVGYVATIGTILFQAVTTVGYEGTVGTLMAGQVTASVQSGYIITGQNYMQTNIQTNTAVIASGASTLITGTMQDMVVDVVYGSVVAGSIQTTVMGVEPQSNRTTSTIVGGGWWATSTPNMGQRLVAIGPLGYKVAVAWNVGASSSIVGLYITAIQSTSL